MPSVIAFAAACLRIHVFTRTLRIRPLYCKPALGCSNVVTPRPLAYGIKETYILTAIPAIRL